MERMFYESFSGFYLLVFWTFSFHQTHIEHLLLYIPKKIGLYINVFVDYFWK